MRLCAHLRNAKCVAYDDYREDHPQHRDAQGRSDTDAYGALRRRARAAVAAALRQRGSVGVVVVDDTMHLASMRRSMYRLARDGAREVKRCWLWLQRDRIYGERERDSVMIRVDRCLIHHSSRPLPLERAALAVVHVDTPLEVCIVRDAQRPRPIGAATIRHMAARFEPPRPELRSWEPHVLRVAGDAEDVANIL